MTQIQFIFDKDDARPVTCDNCDWVGEAGETQWLISDIQERIEPGYEVPVGECPECGALCYLDTVVEPLETPRERRSAPVGEDAATTAPRHTYAYDTVWQYRLHGPGWYILNPHGEHVAQVTGDADAVRLMTKSPQLHDALLRLLNRQDTAKQSPEAMTAAQLLEEIAAGRRPSR